jgi:hypothetical protein
MLSQKEVMYPYHIQRIQYLEPVDMCSLLELCHWINSKPHMIHNILFIDKAHFTRNGVSNKRNSHLWDRDNPHGTAESNYQHRFSVNMRCYVVSLVTNSVVNTFSRNVWQVIFTPTFCKMNCQHS